MLALDKKIIYNYFYAQFIEDYKFNVLLKFEI